MGVRLTNLPKYLERWQVPHVLVDGWQTRSRSSGDLVDFMGIGVHHTASTTTPVRDQAWCIVNSPDKPIGNCLLDRDGVVHLWSIRATNTQGKGGPYLTSRGVIPLDSANTRVFAIEAANGGTGEPWPAAQIETYLRMCCALLDCSKETGALTVGDIIAHFEWTPGRKFDPAGVSPYAAGGALWDMDAFRGDVFARLMAGPPGTTPEPDPIPQPEEDDMTQAQYDALMSEVARISDQLATVGSQVANVAANIYGGPNDDPPYDASTWGRIDDANRKLDQLLTPEQP